MNTNIRQRLEDSRLYELRTLANALDLKHTGLSKEELVEALMAIDKNRLRNNLGLTWWSRHHKKVGFGATVLSFVVGMVGFWAVMFPPKRNLSYYVYPNRSVVFRKGEQNQFEFRHQGRLVDEDVTTAQISMWNAGAIPIRTDEILEPVQIHLGSDAQILETRILRFSREPIDLKVTRSADASPSEALVSFAILERRDGGVVQITYAGGADVEITVNGVIEGQPEPNRFDHGKWGHIAMLRPTQVYIQSSVLLALAPLLLIFGIAPFLLRGKKTVWETLAKLTWFLLVLAVTVFYCSVALDRLQAALSRSPFPI